MNEVELSIIIPIYNAEAYLRECLDSIYALKINKEVILVNDGSQDHSFDIMKEYQKQFPEETIIVNQENQGVSATRNRGLEIARGRYIYFMDSDDFIDTKGYQLFFKEIKDSNVDILLGNGFFYRKYQTREKLLEKDEDYTIQNTMLGTELLYKMYDVNGYKDYVCIRIYRKQYLTENNFSFHEGITYEDMIFSFETLWKAKNVKYVPNYFYYYRKGVDSITSRTRNGLDYFYVHNFLIDFILEKKIEHSNITRKIISHIRSLAKKENMFNEEIYRKLWKLPKKNFLCYRNLIGMYLKKRKLKQISYQDIMNKGKKSI